MGNRPTALGAHIYSGAFTLGVQKNFDIVGQWEEGPWGADTFDLNFPGIPHPLTLAEWPADAHAGKVNLLYANCPCAPWSMVGGRLGMADPRLQFSKNVVSLALILKPDFFILESVPRAWSPTGGRAFYTEQMEWLEKAGYATTVLLTTAMLHGAPQYRERFHLIAHRYQLDLTPPVVDPFFYPLAGEMLADLVDSARWLGEEPVLPNHVVRPLDERSMRVVERLPQGKGFNKVAEELRAEGQDVKNWRMIAGRMRADAPSRTMVDIGSVIHPTENRQLTIREGARLCGYPDDFQFALTNDRNYGARASDVTQAVLPAMGEYLSGLCLQALDGDLATPGGIEVVDFRPLVRKYSPGRYQKTLAREREERGA